MENIEITEKNFTIYEELLHNKDEEESVRISQLGLHVGGPIVGGLLAEVLLKLTGTLIPFGLSAFVTVPMMILGSTLYVRKRIKCKRKMKEFKENYPKIDTTIEKKELKEKLKEYQNNLEEEVLNIKEQQKYNEDMYFTGSFEELSREEKLEVLRIEREKLVSSEEKELEKQKVYQKSNDLKGFHEA